MANSIQLDIFRQGVSAWNVWRVKHPTVLPDLSYANLMGANLIRADLTNVNFRGADLMRANLRRADLQGANLRGAQLRKANLTLADLRGANLSEANLTLADFRDADLSEANLGGADLREADLRKVQFKGARLVKAHLKDADLREASLSFTDLSHANLHAANLWKADLSFTNLSYANLREANLSLTNLNAANFSVADLSSANLSYANLSKAILIETNLTEAVLNGCSIQDMALCQVKLAGTKQENLVFRSGDAVTITLDNLKVAQFLALLLDNQDIREVIGTVARKAVLVLGHFSPERKAFLDALRDALRQQDYLPIVFEFEAPISAVSLETLKILADLTRFILVEVTEAADLFPTVQAILPHEEISIQPLFYGEALPSGISVDFQQYPQILPIHFYKDRDSLALSLQEMIPLLTRQTARKAEYARQEISHA
jgi:uncharacterized protein YjbI with pentapeptide repeats